MKAPPSGVVTQAPYRSYARLIFEREVHPGRSLTLTDIEYEHSDMAKRDRYELSGGAVNYMFLRYH